MNDTGGSKQVGFFTKPKYYKNTRIELCYQADPVLFGMAKHVLFDHDGTISILRQGWEKIMKEVMTKVIIGDKSDQIGDIIANNIESRVDDYIDRSTGIQTILQMEALVEMVKEFNLVPKEKILDKFAYKGIYNKELMKIVNNRIDSIRKGEKTTEDFTIKGALNFLKILEKQNVKLYLASGTDRDDVIRDATELGYADIFKDRIYGALGDINKYSKKMILRKIINENNLKGNELAVIGDGPVEIKECCSCKGIAIGIASDEVKKSGINMKKRTRLAESGAQIIISDFSESEQLIKLILGK